MNSPTMPADQSLARRVNRRTVLDLVKRFGTCTRPQLVEASGLTARTVNSILGDLAKVGLTDDGPAEVLTVPRGRPPAVIRFASQRWGVFAAQVGGTVVRIEVANGCGESLGRVHFEAAPSLGQILDDVVASVTEMSEKLDIELAAGCVVVPGDVDVAGGVVDVPSLGWRSVPVGRILLDRLAVPVEVRNANQAAMLAEIAMGVAVGSNDVVFLSSGDVLAACATVSGRVFTGHHDRALRIAEMLQPDGSLLGDLATASGIVAEARRRLRSGAASSLSAMALDEITVYDVFNADADGDPLAGELLDAASHVIGTVGSWLLHTFDPEVLVLGGAIARLSDRHRRLVSERITGSAPGSAARVRVSELGPKAWVAGALMFATQRVDQLHDDLLARA